jgi:hypothetical protein
MINTIELKRKNIVLAKVKYASEPIEVIVEDIGECGINMEWMHEMSAYEHNANDLFPIPLTPEWLEKFGFKKEPDTDIYSIPTYSHSDLIMRNESYEEWHFIYNDKRLRVIKFVHQLQNLYFALTGEELTIKETQPS